MGNLQNLDIFSYLREKGVTIYSEGKNVSPGWVGIKCLWCNDQSNHLGINVRSKLIKCWKCKRKGNAIGIIQKLEGISWDSAERIAEKYQSTYIPIPKKDFTPSIKPEEVLPKEAKEEPLPMHIKYLEERNFIPWELIRKYKLKFSHQLGRYKYRIIIPIVMDGRTVGFTARDVTKRAELRYISSDRDKYLVDPDTIFYNIDTIQDTALIVEGATDVWRLGEGACATLGTEFNNWHINYLINRGVKKAFIIYDPEPEAIKLAEKMGAMLSVVMETEVIILDEGDPGSLSPIDALQLKRELLGG